MPSISDHILNHPEKDFRRCLIRKDFPQGSLIPLLQSAQETYGYIPENVIHYISELVNIPAADIYGVITFYAQFRLKPLGKFLIKVCQGTACHVNGAKEVLKTVQNELGVTVNETTADGIFTLQSVACLGCCSLSPALMIENKTYGQLTTTRIKTIIKSYMNESKDKE